MGSYHELLLEVLDEYKRVSQVPKCTKAMLAAKYIDFLVGSRNYISLVSYLDLHKTYSCEDLGEGLVNILYPHEKEGKALAASCIYEKTRRHALRLFDKVLESEFTRHNRGRIYEFKRSSSTSTK
jgi:hypothetical protein